jgi:hypothetical protein
MLNLTDYELAVIKHELLKAMCDTCTQAEYPELEAIHDKIRNYLG